LVAQIDVEYPLDLFVQLFCNGIYTIYYVEVKVILMSTLLEYTKYHLKPL
jgi:hypothetical protein